MVAKKRKAKRRSKVREVLDRFPLPVVPVVPPVIPDRGDMVKAACRRLAAELGGVEAASIVVVRKTGQEMNVLFTTAFQNEPAEGIEYILARELERHAAFVKSNPPKRETKTWTDATG